MGCSAISVTSATFSQRGEARDEVVELKDEADVLAAEAGERGVVGGGEVVIAVADLAAGRHVEAAEDVQQGRLAAARGTEKDDEFARVEIEIDAAQRVDLHLAHAVDLGDAVHVEDRVRGCHGTI